MRVTFFGAVGTVTGSMHLVETADRALLLDRGLFQGRPPDARRGNRQFPFPPSSIDAVLLSHAHLDHCGNLPTLVRQGFRGKILCTPATRDLAALIIRDSAEIQHQDANFANKARARQGQPPLQPLYTIDDAEQAIRRLRPVPYHQTFQVGPVTGAFYDAGHILRPAITVLTVEGRTVDFSGDLGRTAAPIIRDPEFPPAADLLIMEATYGDRRHEPFERGERKLADVVRGTVRRGGTILIPAFAVGRTQDITYTLHRLQDGGEIPPVPTFFDNPKATGAPALFRKHPEAFDAEMRARLRRGDPFAGRDIRYVRSVEESKE